MGFRKFTPVRKHRKKPMSNLYYDKAMKEFDERRISHPQETIDALLEQQKRQAMTIHTLRKLLDDTNANVLIAIQALEKTNE